MSYNLESCVCRNREVVVFLVVGNHDRLHMDIAVTIGKCLSVSLLRLPFAVNLQIAVAATMFTS